MKHHNFASDNNAGISPEALRGLVHANQHHCPAYGDDATTKKAREVLELWFERPCGIYFVTGGTAANCISITGSLRSYHSVICHNWAHIQNDECHAPGFFLPGVQLRPIDGPNGKLLPESLAPVFELSHGVHGTQPGMVSITQCTEGGTVYRANEIEALSESAHALGLLVHMDGARFSNALAATGATAAEMSWKAGVDLLSLGGVKNGLAFGEALVVFNPEPMDRLDYHIKQSGQLSSKMRFLSGPWATHIESGEWLRNALHSNAMAKMLASGLNAIPGVAITVPVESNAVFCSMPEPVYSRMIAMGWAFYPFPQMGGYRLMCSWDTQPSDIAAFVNDLKEQVESRQ
jgi:threonine aldolase